ncbi:hypothetical protein FQN60_018755, partial [Etheostoma spectabile]
MNLMNCQHMEFKQINHDQVNVASGRPFVMYSFPELHSAEDRLKPIAMEEVTLVWKSVLLKASLPCNELFFELRCLLMEEKGWDAPADPLAAADLHHVKR